MPIQSEDLVYAVISIDVYQRTGVADGAVVADPAPYTVIEQEVDNSTGFGAAAYNVDGRIVISYRGADTNTAGAFLTDLFYGFGTGINNPLSTQAAQAIEFYKQIKADNPGVEIELTGTSLGGGLAGMVAGLFGESAVIFGNMGFEGAVGNTHEYATTGEIHIRPDDPNPQVIVNEELKSFLYGDDTPAAPDFNDIKSIHVKGDIIVEARELIGAQTIETNEIALDSEAALSGRDRHQISLTTLLMFNDLEGSEWRNAEVPVADALYTDAVFTANGLNSGSDGREVIAYTTIDSVGKPFGDAAATVWRGDVNKLAKAVQLGGISAFDHARFGEYPFEEFAVAEIVTQFASWLAINQVSGSAATSVLSLDESAKTLSIDLSESSWKLDGSTPTQIVGKQDLFAELAFAEDVDLSHLFDLAFDDAPGESIEQITLALGAGGTWEMSPGISNKVTAFFGTVDDDVILGTSGKDFIYAGESTGNDTIFGNADNDLIISGNGDDQLFGGLGKDILIGGDGVDVLDGSSAANNLADLDKFDIDIWQDRVFFDDGESDRLEGGAGEDFYFLGIAETVDTAFEQAVMHSSYSGSFSNFFDVVIYENYSSSQYFTKEINLSSYDDVDVIFDSDKDGVILVETSTWGYAPDLGAYATLDVLDEFSNASYVKAKGAVGVYFLGGTGGYAGNSLGFVYYEGGNLYGFSTYDKFGQKFHSMYAGDEGELVGFHARFVIEDFEDGDFGIDLGLPEQGSEEDDNKDFSGNGPSSEGVSYAANGGNDIVIGSLEADYLSGGTGDDTLSGGASDDTLTGEAGNDVLNGNEGHDFVDGGAGSDDLNGGEGDDQLFGGAGGDTVNGGSGDDTLGGDGQIGAPQSGAGDDLLIGGSGNDTYLFAVGDGKDTIREDDQQTDTDELTLLNLATSDVSFQKTGVNNVNLLITILATGETVLVENQFAGDASGLESVSFTGNGSSGGRDSWDRTEIEAAAVAGTPANTAPAVTNAIADQSSYEDTAWSFTVPADTFTDADGDALNYSATLSDGSSLPVWLSFDASTRTFSGTPQQDFNGTLSLKVIASDGIDTAEDVFDLVIDPVNDVPVVANAVSDQSASEDAAWSFTVPEDTFSDVDGDSLTYSTTLSDGSALPSWLSFDDATRTFTGTPPAGAAGVVGLIVLASDGIETASANFSITVSPADGGGNTAPVVTYQVPDQDVAAGAELSYEIPVFPFEDADGDDIAVSMTMADGSDLPAWLSFDTSNGTLSGTAPADFSGILNLRLVGSDGQDEAEILFDLTVEASGTTVPEATWTGTDSADTVWFTSADDVLDGRKGDDDINGAGGSDTFLWRKGDGNDTLGVTANVGDTDELYLLDVTPDDVEVAIDPDWASHITLTVTSTGEIITLTDQLGDGYEGSRFDQVRFADGTIWDFATLSEKAQTSDVPVATWTGTDGADVVWLGNSDDVIDAGKGDDDINGTGGSDTFLWRKGDGNDTLGVFANSGDTDEIYLIDVEQSDVEIGIDADWASHITVTINSTGEVITLTDQLGSGNEGSRFDQIRFADDTVSTITFGTDNGEVIATGVSNDIIFSGGGDDQISGGSGRDWMSGGSGNDTFVFGAGEIGHDTVIDFTAGSGSEDLLQFDTTVFADMAAVIAAATDDGSDTIISIDAETSITLQGVTVSGLHQDDFSFV